MPFGGHNEPSETELKFTLGPGVLQALAEHPVISNPSQHARLRSVYFDTPEHDLRDQGLSFRIRECDGRFVQTLKGRNGSVIARGEWENDVAACAPELAALRESPFGATILALENRLTPVFVTVLDRLVSIWSDAESEIEISLDIGEVIAQDGAHPIHELELELRRGDVASLFRLGRELSAKALLIPSFQSKAERGYRLAGHEGGAALRAEAAGITRKTTADDAFRQIVRTCLRQISGNAELFEAAKTPRTLHQVRVGVRRLRAALKVFKGVVDPALSDAMKRECVWLARELELARDIDVFADRHLAASEGGSSIEPRLAAFHARVLEAQALAAEKAAKAFRSTRFARFLLDLTAWVELPNVAASPSNTDAPGSVLAARLGRERLAKFARRVRKACTKFDRLDPAGRHRLRLRVKTLRYAAEVLASAFRASPEGVNRYLEAAKSLQERLGVLNDAHCARNTALKIVGARASDLAFTAGLLVADSSGQHPKLIRQADKAVRRFLHAKAFWTSA